VNGAALGDQMLKDWAVDKSAPRYSNRQQFEDNPADTSFRLGVRRGVKLVASIKR
jgi:hypothetical protein